MFRSLLFISLLFFSWCYSDPFEVIEMKDLKNDKKILFWGDIHSGNQRTNVACYNQFFKYFSLKSHSSINNSVKSLFFLYERGIECGDWNINEVRSIAKVVSQKKTLSKELLINWCLKNDSDGFLLTLLNFLSYFFDINSMMTKNEVPVDFYGSDIRIPFPNYKHMLTMEWQKEVCDHSPNFYINAIEKTLACLNESIANLNDDAKDFCFQLYQSIEVSFSKVVTALKSVQCNCSIDLLNMRLSDIANHSAQDGNEEFIYELYMKIFKLEKAQINLFDLDYLIKILTFKTNGIVYAGMTHTRNLVRYLEMLGWEKTVLHKFQKRLCIHDMRRAAVAGIFYEDDFFESDDGVWSDCLNVECYIPAGEECYKRVLSL